MFVVFAHWNRNTHTHTHTYCRVLTVWSQVQSPRRASHSISLMMHIPLETQHNEHLEVSECIRTERRSEANMTEEEAQSSGVKRSKRTDEYFTL